MKCYRGYNGVYPNLGIRNTQSHIWCTNDKSRAEFYASEFQNPKIAELVIPENKLICASEDFCADEFENWDEFGGDINTDTQICNNLRKMGYNSICFENEDGSKDYLLFDKSLISSIDEDVLDEAIEETIDTLLFLSGCAPLSESER